MPRIKQWGGVLSGTKWCQFFCVSRYIMGWCNSHLDDNLMLLSPTSRSISSGEELPRVYCVMKNLEMWGRSIACCCKRCSAVNMTVFNTALVSSSVSLSTVALNLQISMFVSKCIVWRIGFNHECPLVYWDEACNMWSRYSLLVSFLHPILFCWGAWTLSQHQGYAY